MSARHKNLYTCMDPTLEGPKPEVVSLEPTPFLGNFPPAARLQEQRGSVLLPYR